MPNIPFEKQILPPDYLTSALVDDIEDIILKSLNEHLIARQEVSSSGLTRKGDHRAILEQVARIDVHRDRLCLCLKSPNNAGSNESSGEESFSVPWQKPPSKRSRQILLPHGASRTDVRPERAERRAHLVGAIARGRRWLDEVVSGSITEAEQIATRECYTVRQVNLTISLAFLAPALIRAAVEGRLPRGIGIERLRDAPAEWARQFEALGLNPSKAGLP